MGTGAAGGLLIPAPALCQRLLAAGLLGDPVRVQQVRQRQHADQPIRIGAARHRKQRLGTR